MWACISAIGAAGLLLYIVLRMLASKGAGRFSATVGPLTRHQPTRRRFNKATWTSSPRVIHKSPGMLRGAVKEHEQKTAASAAGADSFFGSSPPIASTPKLGSQASNPSYRNPLRPATASAMNGSRMFLHPQRASNGIKRTASGMAKALDGTFEDSAGSRQNPISLDARPSNSNNTRQIPKNDYFDENDFDSDIDLDVEEPVAKKAPTYPKVSASRASNVANTTPVVYPTLPRQQQAQTSFSRDAAPTYDPFGNASQHKAVPSSAPMPWSSSPPEHHHAGISPIKPKPKPRLQDFTFKPRGTVQTLQSGDPLPTADAKPAKRRTLPWHEDEEVPQQSTRPSFNSTPSSRSAHPWNTTASAVKEQQKKHREETKRAVKKNDGDEESILKAKSTRERPARVFLSEEQQHVLNLVIEKKKSAFFTGSAGTGKSVLMREIIAGLRRVYKREPDRVAVTASTGLAACNIGGVTLHSFAGIGLGKEDATDLVKKIKKNQKAKHRWMRTKVLVIDEISMVDGDLFDKLEAIARSLRMNGRPFGGIQLVITGDFFQLPPVPDYGRVAKFAFDAATWNTTIDHTIGLHHVFRQKDPIFAGMLNEMREGRLQQSSIDAFRKLNRPLNFEDELEATELFPTRNEVDNANATRLRLLQGKDFVFESKDGGAIVDKPQRDKLLSNCMAPGSIVLKKGAQVMLIKNVDESLVNGSIGKVIGFMDEKKFDSYQATEADGSGVIATQTTSDFNPEEAARRHLMESITTIRQWPVVRFNLTDGTSRDLLCQPESWKIELPNGEVQASRSQVPLILAWALSIHKAQGQTLNRVKVDLGKVFEKGQAYVALSRATSMAGLQVLRFDPKKVNAHDRVRTFYNNLSRVELDEKADGKKRKTEKKSGFDAKEYEKRFVDDEWADMA